MLAIQKAITERNPCNTSKTCDRDKDQCSFHGSRLGSYHDGRLNNKGDAVVMRTEGWNKGEGGNQDR